MDIEQDGLTQLYRAIAVDSVKQNPSGVSKAGTLP